MVPAVETQHVPFRERLALHDVIGKWYSMSPKAELPERMKHLSREHKRLTAHELAWRLFFGESGHHSFPRRCPLMGKHLLGPGGVNPDWFPIVHKGLRCHRLIEQRVRISHKDEIRIRVLVGIHFFNLLPHITFWVFPVNSHRVSESNAKFGNTSEAMPEIGGIVFAGFDE